MTTTIPPVVLVRPWWIRPDWSHEIDQCSACGTTMTLRTGCEWADEPELNVCDNCAHKHLEIAWQKLESLMSIVTTDHETKEAFITRVRAILGPNA